MHEHQAHDCQVSRGVETGPEARHFIDGERHDVELRLLHSQPADCDPCAAKAHRFTLQKSLLKAASDLTGSIRELVADGSIGVSDAVINGGGRGPWLEAGLEAQVILEGRRGEVRLRDVACVMQALPPANKVQQVVSVAAQTRVCQPANILAVQVTINPTDSPSGGLLYHLNRAVCVRCGLVEDHMELHMSGLQKRLELLRVTTLNKEGVGIVSRGQKDAAGVDTL